MDSDKDITSGVIPGVEFGFTKRSADLQEAIDALSTDLFGRTREEGFCVGCGAEVRSSDFRDEVSLKEYGISALCQECQDAIFDGEVDEEEQEQEQEQDLD